MRRLADRVELNRRDLEFLPTPRLPDTGDAIMDQRPIGRPRSITTANCGNRSRIATRKSISHRPRDRTEQPPPRPFDHTNTSNERVEATAEPRRSANPRPTGLASRGGPPPGGDGFFRIVAPAHLVHDKAARRIPKSPLLAGNPLAVFSGRTATRHGL